MWRERVSAATTSVRVFTPYFDRLLVDLLAESALPGYTKTVVTDLSPRSGNQQYRAQLLAALDLLERGVELVSLERLHAKVLVVDEGAVSVGSQNFTHYATNSRETTANIREPDEDFTAVLDEWYQASVSVPEQFVRELLATLEEQIRAVEEATAVLEEAFDEQWQRFNDEGEVLARRARSVAAAQASRVAAAARFRQTANRRALTRVSGGLVEMEPYDWNDERMTFRRTDRYADFTHWRVRDDDNGSRVVRLSRLMMYPVVRLDTSKLTFTRAVQTQLSYARFDVRLAGRSLLKRRFTSQVHFPQGEEANMTLTLFPDEWAGHQRVRAEIIFDGTTAELLSVQTLNGEAQWQAYAMGALADKTALTNFVGSCLSPFTFRKLEVGKVNADDFFPNWGTVSLLDFHGHPILAVE